MNCVPDMIRRPLMLRQLVSEDRQVNNIGPRRRFHLTIAAWSRGAAGSGPWGACRSCRTLKCRLKARPGRPAGPGTGILMHPTRPSPVAQMERRMQTSSRELPMQCTAHRMSPHPLLSFGLPGPKGPSTPHAMRRSIPRHAMQTRNQTAATPTSTSAPLPRHDQQDRMDAKKPRRRAPFQP